MDLSIIIVGDNTKALTLRCVESVAEHIGGKLSHEILVVDNNSRDGTQGRLTDYAGGSPANALFKPGPT